MDIEYLDPDDEKRIKEIAKEYLSKEEIKDNKKLFSDACQKKPDDIFGFKAIVDGDIVGFIIGEIMEQEEKLDNYFTVETPVITSEKSIIIQHTYVIKSEHNNEYGSKLIDRLLNEKNDGSITRIFAEVWKHPDITDAVSIFEQRGFEEIYSDEEYWTEYTCEIHNESLETCPCEGSVYRMISNDSLYQRYRRDGY